MKSTRLSAVYVRCTSRFGAPSVSKESCNRSINLFIAPFAIFSSTEMMSAFMVFCNYGCLLAELVNLDILRDRLAEAHDDHLDRGCRLKPKFCLETRFGLTALYILCQDCNTFEVVI
ncbi:RPA-interacting protein [Theobroma cacao]|nr:RPA-interacting protein [Theobroma cacao]